MRWLKQLQFEGRGTAGDRPTILVDGDTQVATSPVELLLLAAATCTASDIVIILQKQRVQLEALAIDVDGTRRDEEPRRFTATFHISSARGRTRSVQRRSISPSRSNARSWPRPRPTSRSATTPLPSPLVLLSVPSFSPSC